MIKSLLFLVSTAISCNAVLQKTTERSGDSYSIYYGQDFGQVFWTSESLKAAKIAIGNKVLIIKSMADLADIPTSFNIEELIDFFNPFFSASNVKVLTIINVIYIFRQLVKTSAVSRAGIKKAITDVQLNP